MSNSNYKKMCWDCLFCNKSFSSQSSLCNHKKKFHLNSKSEKNTETINNVDNSKINVDNLINNVDNSKLKPKSLTCDFCDRCFTFRSAKSRHIKVCKVKKYKEEKEQKEEIKNITINNQTINNQIINNQTINNNINNQTFNITNNIIYNFNSNEEKIMIKDIIEEKDKKYLCDKNIQNKILELVEMVYTGDKYNSFQNVLLKNKSKYNNDIHIFENNKLILKNKDKILRRLIVNYMCYMKTIDSQINKYNTRIDEDYEKLCRDVFSDKDIENLNKNKISQILYNNNKLISNNIKSYIKDTEKIKNENKNIIKDN